MNDENLRLSNVLDQKDADYKVQYQTFRANLSQAEQENANITSILEQKHKEYSQQIELLAHELNKEKEVSQMANGLRLEYQKSAEIIQCKQNELAETYKKLKDYEYQLGQRNAEVKRLTERDDDYQKIIQNEKTLSECLKDQIKNMEDKHESVMSEQLKSFHKKKEKMESELDSMRAKMKEMENNLSEIQTLHEKDKEDLKRLQSECDKISKEKAEIFAQCKTNQEYNKKFEAHYEQKKKIFKETESELFRLKIKFNDQEEKNSMAIQQLESENSQLKQKEKRFDEIKQENSDLKARVQSLHEDVTFYRERVKTFTFENQTLKNQNNALTKKLGDATYAEEMPNPLNTTSSISSFNSKSVASALNKTRVVNNNLSTPKPRIRFADDSFQKYTSPSLGTNEQFGAADFPEIPDNEMSRRYSTDSYSRTSTNSNNGTIMFNRFNTISETDNEDIFRNEKSLVKSEGENTQMAQRRLTEINLRNKLTKPHLKSSYALEQLPTSNSESTIKEGVLENRDTNSRMSLLNGSLVMKRKLVDEQSKSPQKTPTKQQASKAGRFNTQL